MDTFRCIASVDNLPLWQTHRIQFLIGPSDLDTVKPVPLREQEEVALVDCVSLKKFNNALF